MGMFDIVRNEMPAKNFEQSSIIIVPKPGFCVKLKSKKQEKVFVNICISDKVPAPRRITEDELREILDDIENSPPFKVPMCIGEPHAEVDSGWVVLKNKKCMGRPQEQCIRTSSRPAIIEMDSSASCNPKVIELPDPPVKGDTPKYELVQVNSDNSGELRYLIARISLPKLVSSKGLDLQVGYDLLQLTSHGGIYSLELTLNKPVDEETTVAEFNRDTKVLTVTMPVLSQQA
ncbi:unnamed protein product [Trichobilharzia szidati]|nr:unnamed protein product [Trichobilharzia szidati]